MPKAPEQWEAPKQAEQPSHGRMDRRRFLGAASAGLAASLLAKTTFGQEEEPDSVPDVNEFARAFPAANELQRIQKITTDLRDGAKHILVHMKMLHWHPECATPPEVYRVKICQMQWKQALLSMMEHPRIQLKRVYAEGIHNDQTARLYSTPIDVDEVVEARKKAMPPALVTAVNPFALSSSPPPEILRREDQELFVSHGADCHWQKEGKLELFGAEWPDVRKLYDVAAEQRWSDVDTYLFKYRERAALEIIAADHKTTGRNIAYVFYGSAHDWRDDIAQWNEEYPHETFSLMEISPDCLIRDHSLNEVFFEDPLEKTPPPPTPLDPVTASN